MTEISQLRCGNRTRITIFFFISQTEVIQITIDVQKESTENSPILFNV